MHNFASINQALAGRIDDLGEALGLGPVHSRTSTGLRYGKRGSLSIRADGVFFDHESGTGGDLVSLIHARRECGSMIQAARWAETFLGGGWRDDPLPPAPAVPHVPDDAERIQRALAIWSQAEPLAGTLAADYLESRGVGFAEIAAESGAVRYHHRCPFGNERSPCVVALMVDPMTGEPSGIHRTAISADGQKIDRRMMGRAGIVKLSPDDMVTTGIGIAEGAETSLAVLRSGWRPIWAALSAGGIARFPVLPFVQSLTIFADHDQAGLNAASACSDRWRAAGREVRVLHPPRPGADWNDYLREVDHAK